MLPLSLKVGYLAFVLVLVPVSVHQYGLVNLLWFSNVALIAGLAAVWLEHRTLASMMAVAILLPEIGWILGFASGLARGGEPLFGITGYMFDAGIPLGVRALALYHLFLPWLLLWLVWRLGYDPRAWRAWLPAGWAILVLSWLATSAERNINWMFGPFEPDAALPWRIGWLLLFGAGCTLTWWATHLALARVFGTR